jgi:hypothetical protein
VTRPESRDENAEWYPYFLIKPDPRCPECATIMDWRSTHRWIAITHGAEIRLSDNLSVGRHLHVQDLRVAHRKNRVVRQPKEWERKERFHPVA